MEWSPDYKLYPRYLQGRIKRGRGIGILKNYTPWIHKRDVPSDGTASTSTGLLTGRDHWLLSKPEKAYLYQLERQPTVVDIREQWPILDLKRTLELAARFGIRHKSDRKHQFPEPYTVDFLVLERISGRFFYSGRSIKSKEDSEDPNTRKKLAIEHAWFSERDLPWTNMLSSNYTNTLLDTLGFMREWHKNRYQQDVVAEAEYARMFKSLYSSSAVLDELVERCAKKLHIEKSLAVDRFRYCAWSNSIPLRITEELAMDRPVHLVSDSY